MTLDPVENVWKTPPVELLSNFFIDGEWRPPKTKTSIDIVSAVMEEIVLRVPEGAPEDMDDAIAAARRAFDEGPCPFCLDPIRTHGLYHDIRGHFVTQRQAIQPLPATGKVNWSRAIG